MRASAVAVAILVVLLGACSDDGATSAPARSTTSTTAGLDPVDRFFRYEPEHGRVVARSELVSRGPTIGLAGVEDDDGTSRVVVLALDGEDAGEVATLALPDRYGFQSDFGIDAADVTDDGVFDYLVHLTAGDNVPGAVVTDDGGRWRFLPAPRDVVLGRDPAFTGGYLRSFDNDCTPSCAEGTTTMATWVYDRTADAMQRSDGDDTCAGRERSVLADVDGDDRTDTVWQAFVGTENRLGVCTVAGVETWTSAGAEGELRAIDVERDGRDEIVAGGTSVSQVISEVVVLVGDDLRVVHELSLFDGPTDFDETGEPATWQQWGCEDGTLVQLTATRSGHDADVRREAYVLRDDRATRVADDRSTIDHLPTYGEQLVSPC